MSGKTGLILGIGVLLLLGILGGWFFLHDRGEKPDPVEEVATKIPTETPTPNPAEQLQGKFAGATLANVDPILEEMASDLSGEAEFARWLANDDLIRRVVAAINNIAQGKDPRSHLEFLRPIGSFSVHEKGDTFIIDPSCYHRYDTFAGVFQSIDTSSLVALFEEIEPLLEEANKEISRPGEDFRLHLKQAMEQLLEVPALDGNIRVEPKVLTYRFSDSSLENLSPAQRHLLRMGPENIRKIQAKLRELKAALGL